VIYASIRVDGRGSICESAKAFFNKQEVINIEHLSIEFVSNKKVIDEMYMRGDG
jgi:hypothetical protein